MALTTANAAGLVSGAAAVPPAPVKVRLLRSIRHLGEHVEAGTVLEVSRAQAQELKGMHKAEILPEGKAVVKPAARKAAPAASAPTAAPVVPAKAGTQSPTTQEETES